MSDSAVTKAYRKGFMRGQALALTQSGHSVTEVTEELGVPRRTIYCWLRRGCDKLDGKHSGRGRKTSRRTTRYIAKVVHNDPTSSLSEISAATNLSRMTVSRR